MPRLLTLFNVEPLIREQVVKELGRDIDFDSLSLKLFPPVSLSIRNVIVKGSDIFITESPLIIDEVQVQLNLFALFLRRIEIRKITFKNMEVVICEKEGRNNINELIVEQAIHVREKARTKDRKIQGKGQKTVKSAQPMLFEFVIREFAVKNAQVKYVKYEGNNQPVFEYELFFPNGTFRNVGFSRTIDYRVSVIPSCGGEEIHSRGSFSADEKNILESLTVRARVFTRDIDIANVCSEYLPFLEQDIEKGKFTCEVDIQKEKGAKELSLKGSIAIEEAIMLTECLP